MTDQTPGPAIRLAYADPPYLGCCKLYGHEHGDGGVMPWDGRCWDEIETHRLLLDHLAAFDGWAYCLSSVSLDALACVAPPHRKAVWVKPFAAFKRNVRIAYTWETHRFGHGCFRAFGHPGECWDGGDRPRPKAERLPCDTARRPKNWDHYLRAEANR